MSFSSDLKSNLIRNIQTYPKRIPQVVCGILHSSARVNTINGVDEIQLSTENFNLVKLLKIYSENLEDYAGNLSIEMIKSKKARTRYMLSFSGAENFINIHGLSIVDGEIDSKTPDEIKSKIQRKKDYVMGFFIASGYVSDPKKAYHIEFSLRSEDKANAFIEQLSNLNIKSKYIKRGNFYVVYVKDSNIIADLLTVIGADFARFVFENERIIKNLKNDARRMTNCELANLNKISLVVRRQILAIEKIQETIGLDSLSPKLREAAEVRIKYKEHNLADLGKMLNPPIGKSGINHRLNRIEKIAAKLDVEE